MLEAGAEVESGAGDFVENGCWIFQNLRVAETKDGEAEGPEIAVPVLVMPLLGRLIVDLTVELHDEPRVFAAEIRDIAAHRTLPTKLQTEQLPISKQFPESRFSGR
jgi:hypothetical protein